MSIRWDNCEVGLGLYGASCVAGTGEGSSPSLLGTAVWPGRGPLAVLSHLHGLEEGRQSLLGCACGEAVGSLGPAVLCVTSVV